LAKRQFSTVHCRNSLKIDSAIPLTLAMLGAVAHKRELEDSFDLALGIVLPWSEYRDREKFKEILLQALGGFTYRGRDCRVGLRRFISLPEGGGLFARGRAPKPHRLLRPSSEVNLAVVMVGYRNASLLVIERGQLTRGLTCDLGFSQMVTRVQNFTSGQSEANLVKAICSSREVSDRALAGLTRSSRQELRLLEIEELRQAVGDAKREYVALLQNWLSQQLPLQLSLDEILIGGGTARYLRQELTETLKPYGAQLNWCQTLERRIHQAFGDEVKRNSLAPRLTDVYGLFYKLLEKPLPKLREEGHVA
jgi:hypothetical protein